MSSDVDMDETLRRTMSRLSAFVDTQWDPRVSLRSSPARLSGRCGVDRLPDASLASESGQPSRGERSASSVRLDTSIEWRATLGEGGMGQVRLAVQKALGRTVAVKVLRDDADDDQAARLLLREAVVTGAVEHPNVVPIHDVRVDDRMGPCVILKHIEGTTWDVLMHDPERLAREHDVSDALVWHLRVAIQICNAIGFAHSRGIVHRDIKPENVMVGAFGEVYVLDWGIARKLSPNESGRELQADEAPIPSSSGEGICGTPCYLAPEMLLPEMGTIGPATDVFLIGATLFELVSGAPPHGGKTLEEVIRNALLCEVRVPDHVPDELAEIIETCMQRDPADRFGSVAALRARLEGFLSHLSSIRIADGALSSIDRLEAIAANKYVPIDRQETFRLFGGASFGISAALREWPDNEVATDGRLRLITAMVEIELRDGDPRTAEAVLAPFDDPPKHLLERIASAKRAQEEREKAIRRDAMLGRDHDPRTGRRTRRGIGIIVALVWTSIPLVPAVAKNTFRGELLSAFALISAVSIVMLIGVGIWGRQSLSASHLNRSALMTSIAVPATQLVICGCAYVGDWGSQQLLASFFVAWTVIAVLTAIHLRAAFAIPAVFYLSALLSLLLRPELVWAVVTLGNAVLALVVTIVWRGESVAPSARIEPPE